MSTGGLILLASYGRSEIHICYAASDEYELGPYHGSTICPRRENTKQVRTELRGVAIDTNEASTTKRGIGFAFYDLIADGYADVVAGVSIN